MGQFFENHIKQITDLIKKLKTDSDYSKLSYKIDPCNNFLEFLITNDRDYSYSDSFSNKCTFSIKKYGQSFIKHIESPFIEHDYIIGFLIMIAKEYQISSDKNLPDSAKSILEKYGQESNSNSGYLNTQISNSLNKLPFAIVKHNNNIQFRKIKEDYQKQLDIMKQENNFIQLNKGFLNLAKNKIKSKNFALGLLTFLASIIIFVPLFYSFQAYFIKEISDVLGLSVEEKNNLPLSVVMMGIIAMLVIETILLYFFRVVLHKYNSLTDQVVQLETKQAVIQFIESYVSYKKDNNLTKEELSKFEDIIFSKISPNLKDVPDLPNIITLIESLSKAVKK